MPEVLLTATSYPVDARDWRGRFIWDMVGALASLPEMNLSIWAPPGELPRGAKSVLERDDAAWLEALSQRGGIARELRVTPLRGVVDSIQLLYRLNRTYQELGNRNEACLVHANWLQMALPLWQTRLPCLVTVLGSDLALLRFPGMAAAVRAALRKRRAIVAPNAPWMLAPLRHYLGKEVELRYIPFGVHSRWFSIRRDATAALSRDWLIVSRITPSKLGYLLDWGRGVFGIKRRLHLIGPMQQDCALPDWVVWHGPADPQSLATQWFPRVAGLLTLSNHAEGRPQVMLEAMAAGLPVVASELPAHRDLLQGGRLGYLVDGKHALSDALEDLEQPEVNLRIGDAGRRWVATDIGDWNCCAARYQAAYEELLA